ncbi:hypothetical protein K437DRAFT_79565 [Tilletiaria anomala UBC 951]|uniref:Potassium channel domain-containing protein n=1 Tax=Tilletiaria anomala (strain ATCC 24038 / CBS 436.72 / UBC 951) TaxID=1037660 RepID=A0A066WDN0_TILAU|nr:uncharacterized protein K437DRAFT_79565 [Tilletiaria anomala UBC 951]KDN49214.1 hypothetical protein K437DRAFT_79565 [Tilletiaria anomala UBC 951]
MPFLRSDMRKLARVSYRRTRQRILATVKFFQLFAALISPVSTLYEIPAVSQPWFLVISPAAPPIKVRDPPLCIVLGAFSLALNVIANILLLVSFSHASVAIWRLTSAISFLFFIAELVIALVNITVYGVRRHSIHKDYVYQEGFWCAVGSLMMVGLVVLFLSLHHATYSRPQARKRQEENVLPNISSRDTQGEMRPATLSITSNQSTNASQGIEMQRQGSGLAKEQRKAAYSDDRRRLITMRLNSRAFLLSQFSLYFVVGVQALTFSRIECWSYFDGIYFTVSSMLTVGFGDLHPSKPSTRIMLVPFELVLIALLATEINTIVAVLGGGREERRKQFLRMVERHFENARKKAHRHKDAPPKRNQTTACGQGERSIPAAPANAEGSHPQHSRLLRESEAQEALQIEEMRHWEHLHARQERSLQLFNFIASLILLMVFLITGAALFTATEAWSLGTSLYFTFVSNVTLGYGDVTTTAAGKVVWVLYALCSVPVTTSFVVQTLASILWDSVRRRRKRVEARLEAEQGFESGRVQPATHAELIRRAHVELRDMMALHGNDKNEDALAKAKDMHRLLLETALGAAFQLDVQARSLLLRHLRPVSTPWLLLRADASLEQQEAQAKKGGPPRGTHAAVLDGEDDLIQVEQYRTLFARLCSITEELRRAELREKAILSSSLPSELASDGNTECC